MIRNESVHDPVRICRGSNRWLLSSVRWVFRMISTSMSAVRAEMAKKVTIYHCERSFGV
jgi:hypothetical protein